MENDERLPYSYDLLYDIKTLDQLKREYLLAKNKVKAIEELNAEHGIVIESIEA